MRRLAAVLLAALAAGCGAPEGPGEVRVFAASSLTEVMKTIAADFEKDTGAKVKLNLASSSVLAKQIVEGAPCDVFFSADPEWADFVEKAGLVEPGTRRELLTNTLVLALGRDASPGALSGTTTSWTEWSYLASWLRENDGRIAMGDPSHVPAGRYAKAALQRGGPWTHVERRMLPCESVRAALALVERGEVPIAIVYATDAKASTADLRTVPLPPVAGVDIRYPVLGVQGISDGGRAFLAFLGRERASEVFRKAGFGLCTSPPK